MALRSIDLTNRQANAAGNPRTPGAPAPGRRIRGRWGRWYSCDRSRRVMAGLVMILGCGWGVICPPSARPVTLGIDGIGDCVLMLFGVYLILTAGWARPRPQADRAPNAWSG